ncbi:hypothetical protein HSB1_36090 [Halogranum salarium B-1]|uniref:Uncharacterized protein n=1 Tax=Halogranum salarium B-1 TaxID=1210908 RepID=J3EUT2_9EURY|nr:hypothetical protein HSB1_36090 [Halogranum salarium B-1]
MSRERFPEAWLSAEHRRFVSDFDRYHLSVVTSTAATTADDCSSREYGTTGEKISTESTTTGGLGVYFLVRWLPDVVSELHKGLLVGSRASWRRVVRSALSGPIRPRQA